MSLVIATGPLYAVAQAKALMQLIKATNYEVLEFILQSKQIEQHLKADSNNKVLFLFADLAEIVDKVALSNVGVPNELTTNWSQALMQIKKLLRTYPNQTLLVESCATQQNLSSFGQLYAEFTQTATIKNITNDSLKTFSPLCLLIAQKLAQQSPALHNTQQQLTALATPLAGDNEAVAMSAEAALSQLHTLLTQQQELEQTKQQLKLAQADAQQHKIVLEDAQQATIQAEHAAQENKAEAELILAELHRLQEELEQIYLQQQPTVKRQEQLQSNAGVKSSNRSKLEENKKNKGFLSKRRAKRNLEKKAKQLVGSGLFKAEWYLNTYPDVAADIKLSQNPALHYLQYGGFEGRNPSSEFESSYYLAAYPDVAESGINPLWHYMKMGLYEGRKTKP